MYLHYFYAVAMHAQYPSYEKLFLEPGQLGRSDENVSQTIGIDQYDHKNTDMPFPDHICLDSYQTDTDTDIYMFGSISNLYQYL